MLYWTYKTRQDSLAQDYKQKGLATWSALFIF
ncbi:unnamed protein product, partial [marine sediment metagenome]